MHLNLSILNRVSKWVVFSMVYFQFIKKFSECCILPPQKLASFNLLFYLKSYFIWWITSVKMHLWRQKKSDRKVPPYLLDSIIVVSCSSEGEQKYTFIYSCSHFELQKSQHIRPSYQLSLRIFKSGNEAHDYDRSFVPVKISVYSDDEFFTDRKAFSALQR